MKIIKTSRLFYHHSSSEWFKDSGQSNDDKGDLAKISSREDKVYEVDLCELNRDSAERYVVVFRYGRRHLPLRESSKTPNPVEWEQALNIFESVIVSKQANGYLEENRTDKAREHEKETVKQSKSALTPLDHLSSHISAEAINAQIQKAIQEKNSSYRSRLLWRLAHYDEVTLRQIEFFILDQLKTLVLHGEWYEQYSLIALLGRTRNEELLPLLEPFLKSEVKNVANFAFEAKLMLLEGNKEQLQRCLASVENELPSAVKGNIIESIKEALTSEDSESLTDQLNRTLSLKTNEMGSFLTTCYQLSMLHPSLKPYLLNSIRNISLSPPWFKGIRHIFKIAELRLDCEMYALLSYRVETSKSFYTRGWGQIYFSGEGYIPVEKELKKNDSRLAFSDKTRLYLKHRVRRTLKHLAQKNNRVYLSLAAEILLQFSDDDARVERQISQYDWRTRQYSTLVYDPYASYIAFNDILFGNSKRKKLSSGRTAWITLDSESVHVEREESYPHLWNLKPEIGIELLTQSHCKLVHDFALRLVAEHKEVVEFVDNEQWVYLLQSEYANTRLYAFNTIKLLFSEGLGSDKLIMALCRSRLDEAHEFVIEVLREYPHRLTDVEFLSDLIILSNQRIFEYLSDSVEDSTFLGPQAVLLVEKVIEKLNVQSQPRLDLANEHLSHLFVFLCRVASDGIKAIPLEQIQKLSSQSRETLQWLGVRLLVEQPIAFHQIPPSLLDMIQRSSYISVRSEGLALFNKLSPYDLQPRLAGFVAQYEHGDSLERAALEKVFLVFVNGNQDQQTDCVYALLTIIFRAEKMEGIHQKIQTFLSQHFSDALHTLDKDLVWRLLQAKSLGAQKLGASLFVQREDMGYSIKQWAMLAAHDDVSVRQKIYRLYEENIVLVKDKLPEALKLLESSWDDAQKFGFDYFERHCHKEDWSPQAIINLCDNQLESVQCFGLKLLEAFFEGEQGPYYLSALSQHPSVAIQRFVIRFLEDFASGHEQRILELEPYFKVVLSAINRGRYCKDEVIAFLNKEALENEKLAVFVAELYTNLSITVVEKDRSALILGMIELKKHYPSIQLPMSQKSVPLKGRSGNALHHSSLIQGSTRHGV